VVRASGLKSDDFRRKGGVVARAVDVDLETWWKSRLVDRSGVRHEDDRETGPSLIVEQSPFACSRLDMVSIGE